MYSNKRNRNQPDFKVVRSTIAYERCSHCFHRLEDSAPVILKRGGGAEQVLFFPPFASGGLFTFFLFAPSITGNPLKALVRTLTIIQPSAYIALRWVFTMKDLITEPLLSIWPSAPEAAAAAAMEELKCLGRGGWATVLRPSRTAPRAAAIILL